MISNSFGVAPSEPSSAAVTLRGRKGMKRLLAAAVGSLVAMCLSAPSQAALTIQITHANDQAIPIAVTPFQGQASLPQPVSQIVAADLRNSGALAPLSESSLLPAPAVGSAVDYGVWQQLKARYLVIGRAEAVAGGYRLQYELYDVATHERWLSEAVTVAGTQAQLRQGAHYIADRVFERITGTKGAFRTKLAYVTAQGLGNNQHFGLYISDQDGYGPQEVLTSSEPILSPSWSPDGRKLAYVSFEDKRPAIYVQELATGRRLKLASFVGINGAPSWSPDGRSLAMALSKDGTPDIYLMDLATRNLKRLTQDRAINTEPDFSPDGKSLIYTSDKGGQPQLYRMDLATGSAQRMTFTNRYNAGGHYSPDGRNIYLVTRSNQGFQVARQDVASGRLSVMTNTVWDEAPAVAPNGTIVVYATQKGARGELNAVSADGRASFAIPSAEGNVREPAWSPFLD